MLRKIITWAIVLFIAFYIVTQPHAAGTAVHNLWDGLASAAHSLATFANSL